MLHTYERTCVSPLISFSSPIYTQTPALGVTQSDITQYTLNYKLTNETNYNSVPVAAPRTWVRVTGLQLGRSYNAFVTATNDGGQSNASESISLSKWCV